MSRHGWSRRDLLRGLGGLSLLPLMPSLGCQSSSSPSPIVEKLGTAALGQDGFPKRLVVVYIPNGNWAAELPAGMDFAGSILEPLTPFKDKLMILRGLDLLVHNLPPGEPHQQGM